MPSPLPSSFASAAAGNTQDPSTSTRRGDGIGTGEWSRSRVNGATQTFRRPSGATTSSQSRENTQLASSTSNQTAPYIPPHLNSNFQSSTLRNGNLNESRYSKEQLLGLYKSQREWDSWGKNVADYFMADWNPRDGTPPTGTWGKKDDQQKDNASGPEICWDHGGQVQPLALTEMSEEENALFSASVNSPLKPPPQSASKDNNNAGDRPGRKSSVSQSHLNNYNASPTSNRPSTRRRETADSSGNPMSPSGNSRFFRDEPNTSTPPPSLLRRKTDFRDSNSDAKLGDVDDSSGRQNAAETGAPFGSLKRSATNPVTGAGSSAWPSSSSSSQSSNFAPMGAFGSFSLGPSSTDKKSSLGGSLRGESRFKGLLPRENSEDGGPSSKEKPSLSSLERLPETEHDEANSQWGGERTKTRGVRSETNPFGDEQRSGSAALGGAQDTEAAGQGIDQLGFSAFGMSADNVPGIRELMQNQEHSQHQTPGQPSGNEPMSPTNTNPYQSPHGERAPVDDNDREDPDMSHAHLPNLNALRDDPGMGPFGPIRRGGSGLDIATGDRSQTSSAGPGRGFSGLGGLGGMGGLGTSGGWPTSAAAGTPTRERAGFSNAFGDPIFGSMGDMQSPSVSALGGGGFFGPQGGVSGTGSIGRASKMGSLFPSAMQEQMRGEQGKQDPLANEAARQQSENEARNMIGGGFDPNFPKQSMEQNAFGGGILGLSGLDGGQSYFPSDKLNQPGNMGSGQIPMSSSAVGQPPVSAIGASMEGASQPGQNMSQSSGSPSNIPLPATQQRQMVMPDRMRWIYRDPQGNTQGPWSGLEMHDWFKAGFFTAELQVKKLEDGEYEPLAQLVRRIGNSREPFLVPQIGVPHGPVPNQPSSWTGGPGPGPAAPTGMSTPQSGAAQPPFPSSFPSFGTTLTAEQQNALERRKQEEQYLMARQKEHLAQQQVLMKQMQMQGGPASMHPQLQHHSSAHSLHSQPSYGSITSPGGYQPSPIQGPIQPPQGGGPGFFDGPLRQNTMPNLGSQMLPSDAPNRDEELPGLLDRLNVNRGQAGFGAGQSFGARQQEGSAHSQQVATMLQDRARLQQEQEQYDMQNQGDMTFEQAREREERLRQFHSLRNEEEAAMRGQEGMLPHQPGNEELQLPQDNEDATVSMNQMQQADNNEEVLSLSQQVQKAQRQRQQQAPSQTESPWGKVDNASQPFPPPPSVSPLPAPAAQRNRQNVADALAAESRSQNQTPIETPTTSMAPWAKEGTEGPKGPSLKEIQEAEARKAAQQEEIAAAARRALAEQERLNQPPAPAPGLPSSANWASSGSPSTPNSTAASVWTKPLPSKNTAAPSTAGKKTLAQIQKEEEARKQRQAAANAAQAQAASAASPTVSSSGSGKRYADLAGKTTPSNASAGAWTTVGAGGKAKAPPAAPAGPRSTSGTMAPATLAPKPRTVPTTRPSAIGTTASSTQSKANEEFTKWAKVSLGKGLNTGINVDDFVQQLFLLPPETEIISDSVYANSQTLDGRRFAEEFVRRRKLADKGVVDPAILGAGGNGFGSGSDQKGSSGGWSEVAKKGPVSAPKDEANAAFKVVAAKKKGKR